MRKLEELEYIRITENNFYIKKKGLDLIEEKDQNLFQEFFFTFPQYVSNGKGGKRYLRTSDIETKIGETAYKKWRTITQGNVNKQREIIECLKLEIKDRKRNSNSMYMHNIETWLNKRAWEFYLDRLGENSEDKFGYETSI